MSDRPTEAEAFADSLIAIARAMGDHEGVARLERMKAEYRGPKPVETVPRIPDLEALREAGL